MRRDSVSEQQSLVAFLRKLFGEFKFYRDLNPGLQARVLEIIGLSEYRERNLIFEQGDNADRCYILLSGEVEIWRKSDDPSRSHHDDPVRSVHMATVSNEEASRVAGKMCAAVHALMCSDGKRHPAQNHSKTCEDTSMLGHQIAILSPGMMFGEMSLLDDVPRSASALCREDCTFLTIQKRDFDNIVKHELKLARSKALSAMARPLLINFPFYQELAPEVQDAVPEILHYKRKRKGDVLFRQSDPPGNCYIILTGEVGIWKDAEQPAVQRTQSSSIANSPLQSENPSRCPSMQVTAPQSENPSHGADNRVPSKGANRLGVEPEEHQQHTIDAIGPRRVKSQNEFAVKEALNGEYVQMLKDSHVEQDEPDIVEHTDLGLNIAILENGVLFGEQSLLNDQPRNATASCLEDCEFLEITKTDFQNVLKKVMQKSEARIIPQLVLPLLAEFPLFQSLPSEVRDNLPYVMKHTTKKRGSVLFWQGDSPGNCYIILSGAVDVYAESVEDSISWSSTKIRTTFGSDTVRESCMSLACRLASPQPKLGHKFASAASNISRVLKTSKTRVALAASQKAYGLKTGVLGQGIIFGRRGTAAESQDVTATCAEDCQFLVIEKHDFDTLLMQELKTVKLRQHKLQTQRLLQEFKIFSKFAPAVQARIPSVVTYYSASSGNTLYHEGDASGPCYIVLAGKVMVWKRITCVCGTVFKNDDESCKFCGAQRPQGPPPCECGNFLMDDANFCRKCGRQRPSRDKRTAQCPECCLSIPVIEMNEHRVQHIHDRKNILFNLQTGNVNILRPIKFASRTLHDEPTAEFKDPTEASLVLRDVAALFNIYSVGAEVVRSKQRKHHGQKGCHQLPEQKKWQEELVHNQHLYIKDELIHAGVPANLIRTRVEEGQDAPLYVHMHLVEQDDAQLSPVEQASAAAFRKCEALAKTLAEMTCHISYCTCGNIFSDDSLFCRLCGRARPGDAPAQDAGFLPKAVEGCVPTMTLGTGAIIGQLALVEHGPRQATVICTTDCEFLQIDSGELAEFQKIEQQRMEQEQQQTLEFFYKHLPVLQNLPDATAKAAVEHFDKHEFPLHHVFFRQEEFGDGAYYLILNGSVELFVADSLQFFDNSHLPHNGFRRLGMLMKGSLFSSSGPLGKEAFTAMVASSPCEVWRLGRGNFKHVPETILKALHDLSEQNTFWRMSRVGSLPLLGVNSPNIDYRPHTSVKGPPLGLRLNWNTRPSQTLRSSPMNQTLPPATMSPNTRFNGSPILPSARNSNRARTMGSWRSKESKLKLTMRDPFLPPEPEYVEFVMAPGACLALNGLRPNRRNRKLNSSHATNLPSLG